MTKRSMEMAADTETHRHRQRLQLQIQVLQKLKMQRSGNDIPFAVLHCLVFDSCAMDIFTLIHGVMHRVHERMDASTHVAYAWLPHTMHQNTALVRSFMIRSACLGLSLFHRPCLVICAATRCVSKNKVSFSPARKQKPFIGDTSTRYACD